MPTPAASNEAKLTTDSVYRQYVRCAKFLTPVVLAFLLGSTDAASFVAFRKATKLNATLLHKLVFINLMVLERENTRDIMLTWLLSPHYAFLRRRPYVYLRYGQLAKHFERVFVEFSKFLFDCRMRYHSSYRGY